MSHAQPIVWPTSCSPCRRFAACLTLFLLLAAVIAAQAGCSQEQPATETNHSQIVKKSAAKLSADTKEDKAEEQKPQFSYSPIGKRDPFRSYLADLAAAGPSSDMRKVQETEKYEMDQYKLKGIISHTSAPKALVEDPTGRGHVLRLGTPLGKHGGRVTRITSTGIVVTEEFRGPTGRRIRVPIMIDLPRPEQNILQLQ